MPHHTQHEPQDSHFYLKVDKPLPKKDLSPKLKSVFREVTPSRLKIGVKVIDIFGNNTITILNINLVGRK